MTRENGASRKRLGTALVSPRHDVTAAFVRVVTKRLMFSSSSAAANTGWGRREAKANDAHQLLTTLEHLILSFSVTGQCLTVESLNSGSCEMLYPCHKTIKLERVQHGGTLATNGTNQHCFTDCIYSQRLLARFLP